MPSWAIHLDIAQKLSENMEEKERKDFLLGNILPDVNVRYLINPISKKIPYEITHYGRMQTFNGNTRELPDYEKFIGEYKTILKKPIVLGYLTHLMTDFYWNYHTYIQKGIYEKGKLIGLQGKENVVLGDDELLRQTKVNDFNTFSQYLYKNGIVQIPNFQENLMDSVQPIKEVHIENNDLKGINEYFTNVFKKIKFEEEEDNYKIYSLEEMQENSKENIEFIKKTFEKIE